MRVGFNYPYPWNAYGLYLGSGSPWGSNSVMDDWPRALRDNLARLQDLGVDCVRIFLLGNAHNYGTLNSGRLRLPSELHPKVLGQLVAMFEVFETTGLQVIPSLVDFKAWGEPALDVKGVNNGCSGRHALVTDPAARRTFFEQVLRPFLTIAIPYRHCVYAWEVQNEPVWNLLPALPAWIVGGRRLPYRRLRSFLNQALAMIESKPFVFPSTVGHRFALDTRFLPSGTRKQFHFYPHQRWGRYVVDRTLPEHARTQAFLGEIGTFGKMSDGRCPHGHPWRELRSADTRDVRTRVLERLRVTQAKGYQLVLLWPDVLREPVVGEPDVLKLTPEAQKGIADYCRTR